MSENLSGKLHKQEEDTNIRLALNSIDFTRFIERLPVFQSKAIGIFHYGYDNNYPYKLRQLSYRSSSLITAIRTRKRFLVGQGFPGATAKDVVNGTQIIVNRNGLNAYDLLNHFGEEKSHVNVAIHVNYNALGEAVEFTPISYEFVRRKIPLKDDIFNKYIINNIWHMETEMYRSGGYHYNAFTEEEFNKWSHKKLRNGNYESLEVYEYNPDPVVVKEQIKMSGGIGNYPGQLFYKTNRINDIYSYAFYDSIGDDAQTEAETKLMSISNLQNGLAMSGFLKVPIALDTDEEKDQYQKEIRKLQGSINGGRFATIPVIPGQEITNLFEPVTFPNMDDMFNNQREYARENIFQVFQQAPILNGWEKAGMFNKESEMQAIDSYNARTEPDRNDIEIDLTMLFSNSIIDVPQLPIEIKPIEYVSSENNTNTENDEQNID
jgi:hypothetical protein